MARYRILIVTLTTAYVVPAGSDIPTKPRQKWISDRFHAKKSPEMVNLGCCLSQIILLRKSWGSGLKVRVRPRYLGSAWLFVSPSIDHEFRCILSWSSDSNRRLDPARLRTGHLPQWGYSLLTIFLCSRDYLFLHACFLQFTHQVVCIRQWGSVLSAGLRFYCQSHTTVWWSRQGGSKHTFRRSQITVWSIRQWESSCFLPTTHPRLM